MISKIKMEKGSTVEDESKHEENQKMFLESMFGGKNLGKSKPGPKSGKPKFDALGKRGSFGKEKVR